MKVVKNIFLPARKHFKLSLPEGAEIINICNRIGQPQIYFLCNDEEENLKERFFFILQDNERIDAGDNNKLVYVGSSFCSKIDGASRHIFEIVPR